jgi:hypothetical protein
VIGYQHIDGQMPEALWKKGGYPMKKSEVLEVSLKVLGMYAFLQGIATLGIPISLRENQIALHANIGFSAAAFLPSVLLFLSGAALLFGARKIRVSSISQESSTESETAMTPQLFQSILFSALGILIVSESVAPLGNVVNALNNYALYHHNSRVFMNSFPYYRLAEGLGRLAFGCWLIVGSKSLRRFRCWLLDSAKE